MGVGLVAASMLLGTADAEELIERMDAVSLEVLAPVAGLAVSELVDRLGAEGLVVDDPGMSVRQLAERNDAEADDILASVFR